MAGLSSPTPDMSARLDRQTTKTASQKQDLTLVAADLNSALFDFAPRFMKDQLVKLAQECDERCERDLVPRLQALLRDINEERDGFEKQKQQKVRELRSRLTLLGFDSSAVENAVAQLCSVTPKMFDLVMSGSLLASSIPTTALTFEPLENDDDPSADTSHPSAQGETDFIHVPTSTPSSIGTQLQAHVLAETSVASQSPKRPRSDKQDEHDMPNKRPKIPAEPNELETARPAEIITREVAFPNLETGECIFRHSHQKGFFVIRCERCDAIFSEPPLAYNRALKHFHKHGITGADKEELTNEDVFERFAYQVSGVDMASKYWIKEHLGPMPHTFASTRSAEATNNADIVEDMMHKHKEIDDDFHTPHPKVRESPRNHTADQDQDVETHRRPLRNVPRPDYKELIAGKAPWEESSDVGSERTFTTIQVTHSRSSHKRRLTKPGVAKQTKKPKETGSIKPFGYNEPWPRRSAPS